MTKRVLFLTQTHNVWGGMEQWLHNFTEWLQGHSDWEVRVGLARGTQFNDPDAYRAAHPHIHPIVLDARAGTESARIDAIVRAIETFQPDLVVPIATAAVFPAIARARQRGANVRLVVPVRSLHPDLFVNVVDQFEIVDGVVAISRLIHRWFLEKLPGEAERIHYVRHGVRPPVVQRLQSERLRVGFIGRLEPEIKRALDLIPFARALQQQNIELHIYGSGPSEDELRKSIGWAHFHGYAPQNLLYSTSYPQLDVVLLFSSEEGTPNVVVEAMQHGVVPVVSCYRGQAAEGFVVEGETGLTFDVGDTEEAARLVAGLASDRELLARLSQNAADAVAGDSDVRMHRDWLAIFERTRSLPAKPAGREIVVPRAGRLERVVPAALANAFRALLRPAQHADGWSEWPGTLPADRARVAEVLADLKRLDV
jgi:glycosyltransferase involved in cell wall biosynthesis